MDMTSVYAPITKSFEQDDGTLLVEGIITDGGLDLDQQRCDPTWLKRAVPDWFAVGNLREQHDAHRAVGKAVEHADLGDEGHFIRGRIVDPVAVAKAKAGIFSGFSVGIKAPRISKSADAPNGVITDGQIIEVSLVDRPCNARATLTVCKSATPGTEVMAADFDEDRGLVRCEELVETAEKTAEAERTDMPTLAEKLDPEQVEKLAAAVEPAELPEPVETPAVADEPAAEKTADKAGDPETPGNDNGNVGNAPAFDADAAKALVNATLAKVDGDDMDGFAPPDDEALAAVAISIIGRLIQSEAGDMVANPGEDDDIRCLLSAVASLRWFIRRERQEGGPGGESDAAPYEYLAAQPDSEKTTEAVVADADSAVEALEATQKAIDTVVVGERNELGDVAPAAAPDEAVTKTIDADTAKAAVVEDTDVAEPDALVKALTAALSKADNPLRQTFEAIVKASTETTAEAVTELTARLVKVESMAVPGGPALRRTEVERTNARRTDLMVEAARYKALANGADDIDLRKGYATRAAQLEAELKALVA